MDGDTEAPRPDGAGKGAEKSAPPVEAGKGAKGIHEGGKYTPAPTDCKMVSDFLGIIAPDGQWTFQTFADNKNRTAPARIFHGDQIAELARLNAEGAGIFFMVNRGDGKGRAAKNVTAVRAVFLDLDGKPLPAEFSLKPHLIIESSPGRFHVYWRVEGLPLDDFTPIQKAIAKMFSGDPKVHDRCRVMRVPGFLHLKAEPFRTCIMEMAPDLSPYSADEIRQAFPVYVSHHAEPATGSICEPGRNNWLMSEAGKLRQLGLDEKALVNRLLELNREQCDPPLAENEVRAVAKSVTRYSEGQPSRLTDMGNAERLVRAHGDDARYCHLWKKWLVWNGRVWAVDQSGEIMRRAKDAALSIYDEAKDAAANSSLKTSKEIAKWAHQSQSRPRLEAMIELAKSEVPIAPNDLNRDPLLLNLQNGTLDLRTLTLRDHRHDDLITKIAPVALDPNADCPTWRAFLHRVMDGDRRLIAFLRRAIGYALTASVEEQVLFLLHGTGANGKSTFIEVLLAMLGDYARPTEFRTLLHRDRSDAVRNDLAALFGLRLVTAVEVGQGKRLDEALVKQLTGGDTISARFMRAEFFDFRPEFKLFLAANDKPEIRGQDHAIWRRVMLVPFEVTIPKKDQDKKLPDKLRDELPGILNWAVRGLRSWKHIGLRPPKSIIDATKGYRREMDLLADFFEACCEFDDNYETKAGELYAVYDKWCRDNGEQAVTSRTFGKLMKERGYPAMVTTRNGKSVRVHKGVNLPF